MNKGLGMNCLFVVNPEKGSCGGVQRMVSDHTYAQSQVFINPQKGSDSDSIGSGTSRGSIAGRSAAVGILASNFQPDAQPDEGATYMCLQAVSSPYEPV
jgi:hypothetical protein